MYEESEREEGEEDGDDKEITQFQYSNEYDDDDGYEYNIEESQETDNKEEIEEEEEQEKEQLDLISENISTDYSLGSPEPSLYYKQPYDIRCLGEIELSRSSLLTNPLHIFPELKLDFDLSENLWNEDPPIQYSDKGIDRYIDLVKKYRTWTVKSFIDQLPTDKVDLKYYPLSSKNFRAVFEVLSFNKNVTHVDVTNKMIQNDDEVQALCEFLTKNRVVEVLILKHCRIGPERMLKVAECLSLNVTLTELDLSYCDIRDTAIGELLNAVIHCESLVLLNVAFNNITAKSGEDIENFLSENKYLENLNLSGNFVNEPGLKLAVNGLRDNINENLIYLNLSNNSITDLAHKSILILCLNCNGLEDLDLSRNLLSSLTVQVIASCLPNTKLKKLNLSFNPMTTEDLNLLIESMKNLRQKHSFQYLDLTDKYPHSQNREAIEVIRKVGRTVIFNDYLCDFIIKAPDIKMMVLNRLKAIAEKRPKKKKAKRPPPFGTFFYEVKKDLISKAEFPEFIALTKNKKIIKDQDLQKKIMQAFRDESKKINVGLMRDMYLEAYPETPRPPPPKPPPPPPPAPPPKKKIVKNMHRGKVKKGKEKKII